MPSVELVQLQVVPWWLLGLTSGQVDSRRQVHQLGRIGPSMATSHDGWTLPLDPENIGCSGITTDGFIHSWSSQRHLISCYEKQDAGLDGPLVYSLKALLMALCLFVSKSPSLPAFAVIYNKYGKSVLTSAGVPIPEVQSV